MAVFRPTYHTRIPNGAKIIERCGKRFAKFRQRGGRIVEGQVIGDGKCRVETPEYYARIRHPDGRRVRIPLGVSDKQAAENLALERQREADLGKAGLIDESLACRKKPLIGNSKELPKRKHERDRWGVIVRYKSEIARDDLANAIEGSHLGDYIGSLRSEARSEQHVVEMARTIRRVCVAAGFRSLDEMNADALRIHLTSLISAGLTYRTRNQTLKAMRSFVSWLVLNDRLDRSPFMSIRALNEKRDPNRRERRSLSEEEFAKLVRAALDGKRVEGVCGDERASIYFTAAVTGLRRKELAALRVIDLDLGDAPIFRIVPGHTKAGRDDGPIPIHPGLVERMRKLVAGRAPHEPLFALRTKRGNLRSTARMVQADCAAGGIAYCCDFGVADFHALRSRFITELCRSLDDFSLVVDLARHSDPKLTARTYDQVKLADKRRAISGLRLPECE